MRTPHKIMAAVTLALAAVSVASPSASADSSQAATAAATAAATTTTTTAYQYRGYHGLSSILNITPGMRSAGLRPVAVSIGLQASQEKFAGFWDNKPGPAYLLQKWIDADRYQKLFDESTGDGYQPTVVSATGSGSQASFTALFQKKTGRFFSRHNIGTSEFGGANLYARQNGYIPVSVNVYGTASNPRYVAVWADNPSSITWSLTTATPASQYQRLFDAQVQAGYRPSAIAVGPDGKSYTTVWRKDTIGTWYAFHGLSAAQYQARFDEMTAKGLYPTWIDMENGVYAAVFTTR
ncbi:hypothetical protein ACFHYQ_06710 [Sphaerimonospora cavernae]|uniref:Uncharacterized protein n=1 Tax=Sphaerimonospora cavernae TaxID=1740611 RepID=A0ABV6U4B5_9ACTN